MGQQLGRMVTCDRCGKTVFEPVRNAEGDEGWRTSALYFVETNGWVEPRDYDLGIKDGSYSYQKVLCPECEEERKNVLDNFWQNKK